MFLIQKIKTSIIYSSYLTLPITIVLGIYFYENLITILSFVFVGYVFLITIILAKYAAYPDKMNIIQGVLIAFCIYLPPMLVIVIPYFYFQSLKQLKPLLK